MKPPSNLNVLSIIKSLFPRVKNSVPVIFTLIWFSVMIWLWIWGDTWVFNEQMPFAEVTHRWLATCVLLLVAMFYIGWFIISKLRYFHHRTQQSEQITLDPYEVAENAFVRYLNKWLMALNRHLGIKRAFYKLPWYLVLGMPNTGTTTLIERGNKLDKLINEHEHAENKQINCWLGEKAILIEPAGALIAQTDSEGQFNQLTHRLWHAMLNWVGEIRERQPLNGVIIVIDIHAFSIKNQLEKERYIDVLRQRLQETLKMSQNNLPIYLIFNKIDLLYGFEAWFESLTKKERDEILGVTFNINDKDLSIWLDRFSLFWLNWMDALNRNLFDYFAYRTEPSQKSQVFSFTRQVASIQQDIKLIIEGLFMKTDISAIQGQILRGVYFTSATQAGQMDDLFVQSATVQYHLPTQIYPTWQATESNTYFVKNLFEKVVLAEPNYAEENILFQRKYKKQIYWTSAFATFTGIVFLFGWHHYFKINHVAGNQVLEQVKLFKEIKIEGGSDYYGHLQLPLLNPLRDATLAYGNQLDGMTFIKDMGLYQGNKVGPLVEDTYIKLLQHKFLPSIMHGLLNDLEQAEPNSDEKMEILRIMRMLDDGKNRNPEMIKDFMKNKWSARFLGQKEIQDRLMMHLDYALLKTDWHEARMNNEKDAIADFEPFVQPIKRAQAELSKMPIYQRVYANLRKDAQRTLPPALDLRNQIGPSFDFVFSPTNEQMVLIDNLLTREGMNNYFINNTGKLIDLTATDSWTLDLTRKTDYSEADRFEIERRITDLYVSDYISAWRGGINNIEIKSFESLDEIIASIEQIITGDQPFKRALLTLKDNTTPREIPAGLQGEALNEYLNNPTRKLMTKIQHEFIQSVNTIEEDEGKQSVLQDVYIKLSNVHRYLLAINTSPAPGKAALKAVQMRINDNQNDPISELSQLSRVLPDPLSRWVQELADEAWRTVMLSAINSLEVEWHDKVYLEYEKLIANKYPFDPAAKEDVSLSDFERFFKPNEGILDLFYNEHLNAFIDNDLIINDDISVIKPEILAQIERAKAIQQIFFDGPNGFGVQYSILPKELSANKRRSLLNLDGQLVDFSHSKANQVNLIWPNSLKFATESKLTLMPNSNRSPRSISHIGPWSQLHLIDKGYILGYGEGYFDIRFNLDNGHMDYRIFYDKSRNLFDMSLYSQFTLPPTLY